jgi:hypothetical protein
VHAAFNSHPAALPLDLRARPAPLPEAMLRPEALLRRKLAAPHAAPRPEALLRCEIAASHAPLRPEALLRRELAASHSPLRPEALLRRKLAAPHAPPRPEALLRRHPMIGPPMRLRPLLRRPHPRPRRARPELRPTIHPALHHLPADFLLSAAALRPLHFRSFATSLHTPAILQPAHLRLGLGSALAHLPPLTASLHGLRLRSADQHRHHDPTDQVPHCRTPLIDLRTGPNARELRLLQTQRGRSTRQLMP